jgi:4-diphosphocytidyl-2-C-methyl-D-erythritol kinase
VEVRDSPGHSDQLVGNEGACGCGDDLKEAGGGAGQELSRGSQGSAVRVLCPAKVNLYLRVVGRRPDGYHDLVSVMQPLALADELIVAPVGEGIRLTCDHPDLPRGEGNLVWQAAQRFARETGQPAGVHLTLRKRIPLAAGLGGGSSDAAGVLLALNGLCGQPLDASRLHRLAGELGADVPFFLGRGPAVARGIGTELTAITLPLYWYLLLNPGVPLSTRWVYENLDLSRLPAPPARETWDPDHPENWVRNDLGAVALGRFPELAGLAARLQLMGARAQGVSGSGPTIFGLFDGSEAADRAGRALRPSFPGWLAVTQGLTGQEPETTWENRAWTI